MGLFSDLSALGVEDCESIEIYSESRDHIEKKQKKKALADSEFLFKKNMDCPCCGIDFEAFVVRGGKLTPLGIDDDLRPLFEEMDPLKYDAVICPICGYAAFLKNFDNVTPIQKKKVGETVTPYYSGITHEGYSYSYDDAILRYKMVLYNDIVGYGQNSRRAYTCLKLSWIIRGKLEFEGDDMDMRERKYLEADEYECILKAFEGFELADNKEKYPICGMDEPTFNYLLARLAFKLCKYDKAIRYAYKVIGYQGANAKIKNMALELKYQIRKIIPINDDDEYEYENYN